MKKQSKLSLSTPICLSYLCFFVSVMLFFFIPPSTDEAYYLKWASHLHIGYLDHPPLVAWLPHMLTKLGIPVLTAARLLQLFSFLGTVFFLNKILKSIASQENFSTEHRINIFSLSLLSLGSLLFYFFWTPDTMLPFLYSTCLFFAIRIQEDSESITFLFFFLLFAALSLIAKYTSFFFLAGIFLSFYIKKNLKLKTWIKSFVLLALFISPILYETKIHQGGSFYFLFHRGFFKSYTDPYTSISQDRYEKLFKNQSTPDAELNKKFAEVFKDLGIQSDKSYTSLQSSQKFLQTYFKTYFFEYISSILLFFGFFTIYFLFLLIKNKIFLFKIKNEMEYIYKHPLLFYLLVPSFFYLTFFGILSIFTKVEANWIAPVLIFTPLIFARPIRFASKKWIHKLAFLHVLLISILVGSIFICIHFKPDYTYLLPTRVRKEYFGFKELSEYLTNLKNQQHPHATLLTQNYQIASMLYFFARDLEARQLPGLARPSQWTREFLLENENPDIYFEKNKDLLLVSQDHHPPIFPKHELSEMILLLSCGSQKELEIYKITKSEILNHTPSFKSSCIQGKNQAWFLLSYKAKGETS